MNESALGAVMRRLHLFEFEDMRWFPSPVREAMTDFLSFMGTLADKPLCPFVERLGEAIRETGDNRLIDLASGGGGPALTIARLLRRGRAEPLRVTLTDLFPNAPRLELAEREGRGDVQFVPTPVDATHVPNELRGFRLICNAFHHLPPEAARLCLADAVQQGQGIASLEFVNRSVLSLAQVSVGALTLLLVTPFIRPWRASRFVLTYALPLVPLCTLWDGVVSCFRAYEPEELEELVKSLPANDYNWEIGRLPVPDVPAKITYLIGYPRKRHGM